MGRFSDMYYFKKLETKLYISIKCGIVWTRKMGWHYHGKKSYHLLCWWGTYPMAIFTQLEKLNWAGKRVMAVMTHEGSGLGSCECDLKRICAGATFDKGLAVHGADASRSESVVAAWENLQFSAADITTIVTEKYCAMYRAMLAKDGVTLNKLLDESRLGETSSRLFVLPYW